MTLFLGCRSPDDDFLYSKTDFEGWNKLGILEVLPAFSRDTEKSEGCKYVQEYVTPSMRIWAVSLIWESCSRIWKDREIISKRFDEGASVSFSITTTDTKQALMIRETTVLPLRSR